MKNLTQQQKDALQRIFERAAEDWSEYGQHPGFVSDQGGIQAAAKYRATVNRQFQEAADALGALGIEVDNDWIDEFPLHD